MRDVLVILKLTESYFSRADLASLGELLFQPTPDAASHLKITFITRKCVPCAHCSQVGHLINDSKAGGHLFELIKFSLNGEFDDMKRFPSFIFLTRHSFSYLLPGGCTKVLNNLKEYSPKCLAF